MACQFCLTPFEQIQKCYLLNLQNLMLYQNSSSTFHLRKQLVFQLYSIALKIVTISKVLSCKKLKECFASKVSIALSEMYMSLLVDVVFVLLKLSIHEKKRGKLNSKVKTKCQKCQSLRCKAHSCLVCASCIE